MVDLYYKIIRPILPTYSGTSILQNWGLFSKARVQYRVIDSLNVWTKWVMNILRCRPFHLPYFREQFSWKLFFFEFSKYRKFPIVVAIIFPLFNENLNTFLIRLQKLFKGGNYLWKYDIFLIICKEGKNWEMDSCSLRKPDTFYLGRSCS